MIPGMFAAGARRTGGGDGDPYWANVVALLHCDGANGSTTFVDQKGHTWTASGGAQISTAQSRFGGASGLFTSPGSFIQRPVASGFSIGTGDFTVECWVRLSSTGEKTIHSQWSVSSASNRGLVVDVSTTSLNTYWSSNGIALGGSILRTVSLSTGVWYHVAISRVSGTHRAFIDGVQVGSSASMGSVFNSTRNLFIGRQDGSTLYDHDGYVDDYRLTLGVGRYTSNFTPPAAPFPNGP